MTVDSHRSCGGEREDGLEERGVGLFGVLKDADKSDMLFQRCDSNGHEEMASVPAKLDLQPPRQQCETKVSKHMMLDMVLNITCGVYIFEIKFGSSLDYSGHCAVVNAARAVSPARVCRRRSVNCECVR